MRKRESSRTRGFLRNHRAMILGLVLIPVNVFLLLHMEVGTRTADGLGAGPYPSTISLFANTILFLIVLSFLNKLIASRFGFRALERSELVIVYVMLVISTSIVSIDYLDVLVPMMTYPFRFATPENRWEEIMLPHLSPWVSMSDPVAMKGWYEGNSTLYTWEHIRPWLKPVAVWSGVIFVMIGVMLCINTIVRRQWMENEKLLFPIVEVPMQITEPGHALLKSKLMWIGFAIAGSISLINGLQMLYPALPFIPVKMTDVAPYMQGRPWNAIGWTPISFYPYAIGLGFLLPLDMLFSCWFFYLMWRVLRILGAVYGAYDTTPNFPFMNQQALGAYYFIGMYALWLGRRHLREVYRIAFGGDRNPKESEEPMRYRTAFLGMLVGTAALVWFFQAIGLSWILAVAGVGMYFLIALGIARMHAEFGPPAHDLHRMGPDIALTQALGTRSMGVGELAGLSWFWWFNRAYRSIPIAYQLDGMKLAQRTGTHQRKMLTAIILASVVAVICGFWFYLHMGYERGASVKMSGHVMLFGMEAFAQRLNVWINNPTGPDVPSTLAIGWGMGFTYFLYFMKLRLMWWPFHPLGFAISTSYAINTLWFPLMIAWVAKLLTLRFGGLRLFRIIRDFFLGLLIGDFVVGCMWPMLGWVLDITTYSFMR